MNTQAIPLIIIGSITLFAGFSHVLVYLGQKQRRENLPFAILCFVCVIYDVCSAGLYTAHNVTEGFPWQRAQSVISALALLPFVWFVSNYAARKLNKWIMALGVAFALWVTAGMIFWPSMFYQLAQPDIKAIPLPWGGGVTYYEMASTTISEIEGLAAVIAFVYALLLAFDMYHHGEHMRGRLLGLAILPLFAAALNDSFVESGTFHSIYLLEYAFAGMVLLMTYSLSSMVIKATVVEEQLRESESMFRNFVAQSLDGFALVDGAGNIAEWNHACETITGLLRDQVVGRAFTDVQLELAISEHPSSERQQEIAQAMQAALRTGQSPFINRLIEVIYRRADGTRRIVQQVVFPIHAEHAFWLGTTLRDITELKQTLDALAQERTRLKTVIDNLPDSIYIKDAAGRKMLVNSADLRFMGLDGETEALGKTDFDLFPPELAEQYSVVDRAVIETGQPSLNQEEFVVGRDGRQHWLLTSKLPLRDEQGNITGLLGIGRDITEYKKAVDALRASEHRLSLVLEGSNDGIWDWDLTTGQVQFSRQWAEMLGYRLDEIEPDRAGWKKLLHPQDEPLVTRALEAHLAGRTPHYECEQRLRAKSGEWKWILARGKVVARDEHGAPLRMTGTHTDINDRKLVEAEREHLLHDLAYRTTQLQTAAEVSKSAITVLDPIALMQLAVDLIQERFGFYYVGMFIAEEGDQYAVLQAGAGEAGRRMLDTGHRLAIGGSSMIGWCIANKQARIALDVGQEAIHFDNPLLPLTRSEMVLPLMSHDQITGALTVQSTQARAFSKEDITVLQTMTDQLAIAIENARLYEASRQEIARRRQAEEEVRQLNEEMERRVAERTAQLQAATKELESFAYSVSHDLKAPLRGIDGYSRLLLEDYHDRLDQEGQQFLRTIRKATEQMGRLIDDLLAYSRLERRLFTTGCLDPRPVIESLVAERTDELNRRHIQLTLDVPCAGVNADPAGLAQALRNLVDNAIKFTRDVPEPRIEIGGRETENSCILWVRDNGIGFDMKYHDRVFDMFQRLHRPEEYEGTGVGLAIVRKALQRMGGRVWAESAPGAGATFYMEIPK
jgi:PAS domain S-box-containing protein